MPFSVGASGVWKNVPAAYVGASGVWKAVIAMYVGASGAWKQFFANGLVASLGANNYLTGGSGAGYLGYGSYSAGWGTLSPRLVAGAGNVIEVGNAAVGSAARLRIEVSVSSPSTFLNFVTINGVTLLGSAATYTWTSAGGGIGQWSWPSSTFGITAGNTYPVTIAVNP